ncbi:hypothetical protein [Heyndrickxia vini]|uniref:LAGLIDADG homing endonuclease n=1 Tax=Heyndrickxia vini TaxID=1476025 RepID=A0ABX7E0H7_9BACI|nr:hypothetical protein [Heyndrickxia vini]QQZ08818.1 hypothetical protein I5776_17585 [Heyndrickxia vini]
MEKPSINTDTSTDYTSVRISLNQLKGLLKMYITPLSGLKIRTKDGELFEVNTETIINVLVTHLSRTQLLELLHMFQIIKKRKSNIKHYFEYILQGIVFKDK